MALEIHGTPLSPHTSLNVLGVGAGLLLCAAIAAAASIGAEVETYLFGRVWLEPLVLAILIGAGIRAIFAPDARFSPGIRFSAKIVLEVAVALLGATISAQALSGLGAACIFGIAVLVVAAILVSYSICRALKLPRRMAILIACGNSICGNSAIAAVAPVIGAEGCDVAASISFTAILGVAVVLGIPLLAVPLAMSPKVFGVFAGMTVYAVPQVLAATAAVSPLSVQVGTLVKLTRVLMLGPVVFALTLIARRWKEPGCKTAGASPPLKIQQLAPVFILVFLALMVCRSEGLIPTAVLPPISQTASLLTVVSMAALGLDVDMRALAGAGLRVTAAVTLSLLALGAGALLAIHLLRLV